MNLLNKLYINWLNTFRLAEPTNTVAQARARELISDLENIGSLEKLGAILEKTISQNQYGPLNYNKKLSDWYQEVINISKDCALAKIYLQNLEITPQNALLIRFLTQLMNEPKALLHTSIPSLVYVLNSKNLPELIEFIVSLETAPQPVDPRQGSFAALVPKNSDHQACLALLNNLVKQYNENNPLWVAGNSLLQTSLKIFNEYDMEFVEINLHDEKQEVTPQDKKSECTLM